MIHTKEQFNKMLNTKIDLSKLSEERREFICKEFNNGRLSANSHAPYCFINSYGIRFGFDSAEFESSPLKLSNFSRYRAAYVRRQDESILDSIPVNKIKEHLQRRISKQNSGS